MNELYLLTYFGRVVVVAIGLVGCLLASLLSIYLTALHRTALYCTSCDAIHLTNGPTNLPTKSIDGRKHLLDYLFDGWMDR
jgi:hypothetical protein